MVILLTDDVLVDQAGAGKLLGIPPSTLQKWRSTGECKIPYTKIGNAVRYRTRDLLVYVEEHMVHSEKPRE